MATGVRVTLKEAGSVMEISCLNLKRLKRQRLSEGERGLFHGNRLSH